jgi:signal transduction histidine kinase
VPLDEGVADTLVLPDRGLTSGRSPWGKIAAVARPTTLILILVTGALVAVGWVADRALQGQIAHARADGVTRGAETARLGALSVRATLAAVEQRVLTRAAPEGVVTERLPVSPARAVPRPGTRAYRLRSRGELAKLLHATSTSASGLPEAVLARLALGQGAGVSIPGEPAPPDVGARLLSGSLPVRAEDLPYLAHALGVGHDPRAALLRERLRAAPEAAALPPAPGFRRVRHDAAVEGWTVDGIQRVRYVVPVSALLEMARVPLGAWARVPGPDIPEAAAIAEVPDVKAFALAFPIVDREGPRLRALRIALWTALAGAIVGLAAMRRALASEARANARERRFLASVTHELRSPLAALRLFGERLAQGRGDPREYGVLVAEESQRLEELVERVLATTRASERPHFAPVAPGELMRSAVTLIGPRAERREVTLTCRAAAPLPTATWDAEAVRRAVLNLLDNAIKHGRQGGHVLASAFAEGDAVCLSVADDGPGIGPRERRGLFGRFVRGSTDAPGTGLGLHFAEQVAHAHGGRVDLVTGEGRGCVFTLRLPASPPGNAAPPASEP